MKIQNYKSPYSAPGFRNKRYTLDDLEADEQFQEISERFLNSVGEQSDDIFEYLRDSDFNLLSGMQRAMDSDRFTDQQKRDYAYLRSKFDGADMGSLKQYLELIKDSSFDMVSDPTLVTAVLTTPISGGVSLLGRAALGKGSMEAAKLVTKANLKKIPQKEFDKILKDRTKVASAVTGAEIGAWTGADNYFRQKTEINTGLRKMFSNPELVSSGLLGALGGSLFGGLAQVSENIPIRMLKKYSDDTYRMDAGSDLVYKLRKAGDLLKSKTVGKAVSFLKTDAEISDTARKFGQAIDEEFEKSIFELSKKRLNYSYIEDLSQRRGDYFADFNYALEPIRPSGTLVDTDEQAVLRILRGADPSDQTFTDEQREAASRLRGFFDKIYDDAIEAGISVERIENYFPRSWDRSKIEKDRPEFEKRLVENNIVSADEVGDVVDNMLNKQNELYASHSNLITQARKFENLDDNVFEEFLNNDLLEVTVDYWNNAARVIQNEETFLKGSPKLKVVGKAKIGEQDALIAYRNDNLQRFRANWSDKIDQELRANTKGKRRLSAGDRKRLDNVYQSVTGQLNYYSGVTQGFYDTYKLANAVAYLPLATVSSLTEAMIPFTKAKPSSAVKGTLEAIGNSHKIFTEEASGLLKDKYGMSKEQIRQEMSRVWIAVDEAMGDVTNRLSGEGLQNKFLKKAARGFYRFNLLIPWTKTVQLSAFSTGKDLIRDNLQKLVDLEKQGVKIFDDEQLLIDSINKSKNKSGFKSIIQDIPLIKEVTRNKDFEKVALLKSQLFDYGIDVEDGVRWLKEGADIEDKFYNEQLIRGAGRFTNQVILQTSREGGKLPTFFNNPKADILTQFLRYPTMFSNTILKNFARDVITNPNANAPRIAAFGILSTSVALATNYWRASDAVRQEMDAQGINRDQILRSFQRVGLLGPLEYGLRYSDALKYTPSPLVAGSSLLGPAVGDVVQSIAYNRGLVENIARKAPLVGLRNPIDRYAGDYLENLTGVREPYTPLRKAAKEVDKSIAAFLRGEPKTSRRRFRTGFSVGGLAKGPNVPYTKENPADRIDPYTGMPYAQATEVVKTPAEEQMEKLGLE